MQVINLLNNLANTLFPLTPPSPDAPPPPLSLEDDCSDVCFHSFLTTLSLIEVSAPGSGVSARSGHSDYNMSVAAEMLCFQVRSL